MNSIIIFGVTGVTETKKTIADSVNFLTQIYLTTNLNMFQHLYHVEVLEFTSEAAWATMSLKKHLLKLFGHYGLKSNF